MNYIPLKNQIANFVKSLIVILIVLFSMQSCKVASKSAYFKTLTTKDTTILNFVKNDFESVIVAGDELAIGVSSLSTIEDAIFNNAAALSKESGSGYKVQPDGTILVHRLGRINAAGQTRKELAKKIQNGLLAYTKEPIVQVEYLNHRLTIIGEVRSPQVLKLPQDQISILDALVLSGDITDNGVRNNITIIREEGGDNYVKPNDIILVSADYKKIQSTERKQKLQNTLTLVTTGLSLVLVVLSRFVK